MPAWTLVPEERALSRVVADAVLALLGDPLLVPFSSGLSPVASSPLPSFGLKQRIFFF